MNPITNRLLQTLVAAPLQAVGIWRRAEVLDCLSRGMIKDVVVPGGVLKFFVPTQLLITRADGLMTKEPDTIRWIDEFERGTVFWDIGANVGIFSLYAAKTRRAVVLSFEPSPSNFYVLSRNIHLNALGDCITSYCVAMSRATKLGTLNMQSSAMGVAVNQFGGPGEMSRYWDGNGEGCVQCAVGFSIDDFIGDFNPPFPGHLKLDVDGLEVQILQGAKKTLQDARLRSVMVELSLSDAIERDHAITLLQDAGLRLASCGDVQEMNNEKAANHLFVRCPRSYGA